MCIIAIIHYTNETCLDKYYEALRELSNNMDFSNWELSHPLYSDPRIGSKLKNRLLENREKNRSLPGIFKDELNGRVIKSCYFVCAKTYFIQFNDNNVKNTTKGCRKSRLDMNVERIERFILGREKESELFYNHVEFCIKKHDVIFRRGKRKICDRLYTKRWVSNDGIVTLAYRNPDIQAYLCMYDLVDAVVGERVREKESKIEM